MAVIGWDWSTITVALMWRLAPNGVVIKRRDLRLPEDMVLIEDRQADCIKLRFATVDEAMRLRDLLAPIEKVGVAELQGRWKKIGCVLLWKKARDGITLRQMDLDCIPPDKVLLAHGHAKDIEYRFVIRDEAQRIASWEKDNEGKNVVEAL